MIYLPKIKKLTKQVAPTEDSADKLFAKQNALDNKTSILVGTKGGETVDEKDPYGETFYSSIRHWLKESKQKVP